MPIELRFVCCENPNDHIQVESFEDKVIIWPETTGGKSEIVMDISTAIRFAKAIRTEINKAKEVDNV